MFLCGRYIVWLWIEAALEHGDSLLRGLSRACYHEETKPPRGFLVLR